MLKTLSILFVFLIFLNSCENKDINFPISESRKIISTLKKDKSISIIQKWNIDRRSGNFTFYKDDLSLVYNDKIQNEKRIYIRNPHKFTKEFPLIFDEKFDRLTKYYIIKKPNQYFFVKHSLIDHNILKDTIKLEKVFKEVNPFEDFEYLSNFCQTNEIWAVNNHTKQLTTSFDLGDEFSLIYANNFQELSLEFDYGHFIEIEKNWYICKNEK